MKQVIQIVTLILLAFTCWVLAPRLAIALDNYNATFEEDASGPVCVSDA